MALAEILKGLAALAWPVLVWWAIYQFRDPLGELLSRVKRIGKDGIDIDRAAKESIDSQLVPAPKPSVSSGPAVAQNPRPFVQRQIELLNRQLAELNLESDQREQLLMLRLAESQIGIDMLRTHINMFTSQREALKAMLAANSAVDLTPFYNFHVARYRASPVPIATPLFPFEKWCAHLTINELANINGSFGTLAERARAFAELTQNLPATDVL